MERIAVTDAVGHMLCHDLTQIVKGVYKGPRFRKGHVVTEEDIPILLSMGKEHLYVWEAGPGMVHEDDAAERLAALCVNEHIEKSGPPREGKIELAAACDGLFRIRSRALFDVDMIEGVTVVVRHGDTPVRAGDKLAGVRVTPLVIEEERLRAAEAAAGGTPLLELLPWRLRTAAVVSTGSEVRKGLIRDTFTPVVREKLAAYGMEILEVVYPGDGVEEIAAAVREMRATGADLILCTGGMSVDPDDDTPGGIRAAGAEIVTYGVPVLPGAMFLLGSFDDGTPVCGLPGCVMSAPATVFDLVLPRLIAGARIERRDLVALAEGGLCLGCDPCHFPDCPFGKRAVPAW